MTPTLASRHRAPPARAMRGMTLIELLVALTIGLLVTLVAVAALIAGQGGYRAVDATADLRDRQRFALTQIAELVKQTGYENGTLRKSATRVNELRAGTARADLYEPDVFGWNNSTFVMSQATTAGGAISTATMTARPGSDTTGSDILVIRFQGSSAGLAPDGSANDVADNSMINCAGGGVPGILNVTGGALDINSRPASALYVDTSSGEPNLMCATYQYNPATTSWAWSASPIPLVEGVESFQVLYGVQGITPGAAVAAASAELTSSHNLEPPMDRWLRADQLNVSTDPAGTRRNWRQVRAIKIGIVMRGAPGSAQDKTATTFYPLGTGYESASDKGSKFVVTPADNRLRQVATLTLHLPNWLTLNN